MAKNIVICCDGTANEFAVDRTNVVKLYYTLQQGPEQVTYYHPGLGTMEAPGALTPIGRSVTKTLGLAMGYGLSNDIRDAYTYLLNQYEDGDKVYVFGFSRGAYTARCVCSLLYMYGLIRRGNDPLVPYAIRMMMAINRLHERKQREPGLKIEDDPAMTAYFRLAEDFKKMMCRTECAAHFVGVWDTVSSVGWKDTPVKLPYTADNPAIQIGRHAVAIDEKRAFFRTNLWRRSGEMQEHGPKDCKQVWFAGVHCDVGGGYPEAQSGLSKIALAWMLEEAEAAGLRVNAQRKDEVLGKLGPPYVEENADAKAHESLKGAWEIAELIPKPHYDYKTRTLERRANRGKRRTIPPGSLVHESVKRRHGGAYWKEARVPEDAVWVSTRQDASSGSSAG